MPTRPCLSVSAETFFAPDTQDELSEALRALPQALVEVRLESQGDLALATLERIASVLSPTRLVVTCRAADELPATSHARGASRLVQRAVYRRAIELRCAFVDVDASSLQADSALRDIVSQRTVPTKWLVSCHWYRRTPSLVWCRRAVAQAMQWRADAFKVAVPASPLSSMTPLWSFAFRQRILPVVFVPMGEAGTWARLVAHRAALCPPLTYVRLRGAQATAPGQPDWQTYALLRRSESDGQGGAVYGVVGRPLAHSLSPALHTRVLNHLERPGMYVPFPLATRNELRHFLREVAPVLAVRGVSITLPAKRHAVTLRPRTTAAVRYSGACNTLVRASTTSRGRWFADNTDITALIARLRVLSPQGLAQQRVGVLGAGGVARAAVVAIRTLGGRPVVIARRMRRAKKLATDVWPWPTDPDQTPWHTLSGIVQCTSVGMSPHEEGMPLSALACSRLPANAWLLDTIYQPEETRLVRLARSLGLQAEGGVPMFVAQAAGQCHRFYDVTVSSAWLTEQMRCSLATQTFKASETR